MASQLVFSTLKPHDCSLKAWDHNTSLSESSIAPISCRAESYVAPNSPPCTYLSLSFHPLASLLLPKHAQRIPSQGFCTFSSICLEYSFLGYPYNAHPKVSVARSPCQRGLCWTSYIKEHFLPWPSNQLTHRQSLTGCLWLLSSLFPPLRAPWGQWLYLVVHCSLGQVIGPQ